VQMRVLRFVKFILIYPSAFFYFYLMSTFFSICLHRLFPGRYGRLNVNSVDSFASYISRRYGRLNVNSVDSFCFLQRGAHHNEVR